MEHIFHLWEHLSSHGEFLSLSFQWNLFKQLSWMMAEQSGKRRTFQRQEKQLLWSYSSITGESNWLSAAWECPSANNSHLKHQNKVLVTALGKKMGSCSSCPQATWESWEHSEGDLLCTDHLLGWEKKQWNDATQPQIMILLQSSQNALVGRLKAWVHFQKPHRRLLTRYQK